VKIATFNTNSIRSRLPIVIPWLREKAVDILCMQETKVTDDQFPAAAFHEIGYQTAFRGQKSYNGVAIASSLPIENVAFGLGDGEDSAEDQARLIRCTISGIRILNAYAPQGKAMDHPAFRYKIEWFARLRRLCEQNYSPDEHVLLCGDLNVAPEPRDVYAPDELEGHVCYNEEARAALRRVMDWGLVDVFRMFHPEKDLYTFYDYRVPNAIKRRMGWRIDHILATRTLADRALSAEIDMAPRLAERPSDHTFLVAEFS